jgi:hypothetical protein
MAIGPRLRLLELLVAQYGSPGFRATSGLKTVSLDLAGYLSIGYDKKPALFILASINPGQVQQEPDEMIRELMRITFVGYTQVQGNTADGVAKTREDFLSHVRRFLYSETLITALRDQAAANGQHACSSIYDTGVTNDGGLAPPHGLFNLDVTAILHYHRSQA